MIDCGLWALNSWTKRLWIVLVNRCRDPENHILFCVFQSNSDRFALQRAVNTPINAISTVTGSHLLDKLNRLLRLLAGNSVDVGNRHISARCHPSAPLFCKDLLAKGIVVRTWFPKCFSVARFCWSLDTELIFCAIFVCESDSEICRDSVTVLYLCLW